MPEQDSPLAQKPAALGPQLRAAPTISKENTAALPASLERFSPIEGPHTVKQECPLADKRLGSKQDGGLTDCRPKKPCDVDNLVIQITEPPSMDRAAVPFQYVTANIARGVPSQRPRDLRPDGLAPPFIQSELGTFDIVLEITAACEEPSVSGKFANMNPRNAHDRLMLQSKANVSASASPTILKAGASWGSTCGSTFHSLVSFHQAGDEETKYAGSISETLLSKSKSDQDTLLAFIKSGLDPKTLGQRYEVSAQSCGVCQAGPPTNSLSALVIAYPAGACGVKIAFEGLPVDLGWGDELTDADKYAKDYNAQTGQKLDKAQNNLLRLEGKRPAGGKRIQDAHAVRLKSANQEVRTLKNKLENHVYSESSKFSLAAVIFDEEIDVFQTKRELESLWGDLERAKSIIEGFVNIVTFFTSYAPAPYTPLAKVELKAGAFDIFLGMKISNNDPPKGDRWRALPFVWDIEANLKFLEIGGYLGVMIGKKVLGTGASLEAIGHFNGHIGLGYEYSSPPVWEAGSRHRNNAAIRGEIRATASASGKVSLLYFHLACVSVDVDTSARAFAEIPIDQVLDRSTNTSVVLTLGPGQGWAKVYFAWFKKPKIYPFKVWDGGTRELIL